MRRVAIIQARMGSGRLPGKVLADICGITMLERVVGRVRKAEGIDDVVIATTDRDGDCAVVCECDRLRCPVFRGSDEDVLDRYYNAALQFGADVVVRVCADSPLIDPAVITAIVKPVCSHSTDYSSNKMPPSYPLGLDAEAFTLDALRYAWLNATRFYERSHVTPYLYMRPSHLRIHSVRADRDYSGHRWTVDTEMDLSFMRKVHGLFGAGITSAAFGEVLSFLDGYPELVATNSNVGGKGLEEG